MTRMKEEAEKSRKETEETMEKIKLDLKEQVQLNAIETDISMSSVLQNYIFCRTPEHRFWNLSSFLADIVWNF